MSTSNPIRFALAALLALSVTAGQARADEEFDVHVSAGKVVVKAKGKWHINKQYPWKLVMGETKIDQAKFTLTDTEAMVDAPKGEGKLKGGVCNGDQCKMFQAPVTIP